MTSTEFSLQISKFDHDIAIPDARRFGPLLLLKRSCIVAETVLSSRCSERCLIRNATSVDRLEWGWNRAFGEVVCRNSSLGEFVVWVFQAWPRFVVPNLHPDMMLYHAIRCWKRFENTIISE